MRTYNTYQEAKIASPEEYVYKLETQGAFVTSEIGAESVRFCNFESNGYLCNPVDYCMTVEQFLKAGHKFVVGDLIYNTHPYDKVDEIDPRDLPDYCDLDCDDNKRYILRAAALDKPETTEWDGEGLPPVGCKIKTKHGVSEVLSTSDWDGGVVTYSYGEGMSIACAWNNKSWINPIETENQRKERERLEAAYDLYSSWVSNTYGETLFCFNDFCEAPELCTKWLAIVDKTNYRKGE